MSDHTLSTSILLILYAFSKLGDKKCYKDHSKKLAYRFYL
jgi:hypothetical protein